jgi:hypothetical protein
LFFSILFVVTILLTVGCSAAIGHFILAGRQSRRELQAAVEARDRATEESIQTVAVPADPSNSRVVIITADPSVSFAEERTPTRLGTTLVRTTTGLWIGAYRELTDSEVERLVANGYATVAHTRTTGGSVSTLLNNLGQLSQGPSNPNFDSSFRQMQEQMERDFQAVMRDFQAATASFPLVNSVQRAVTKVETPTPNSSTPKSAIDRLLEDDLIVDEDSGVK